MKKEVSLEQIEAAVSGYSPRIFSPDYGFKRASVLVPFYPGENGLSVVCIKRPSYQGPHSGQISFPGGGREEGDKDDLAVALRETEEEIGAAPENIRILGGLDTQNTVVSMYWVRPFVGALSGSCEFNPDPREVERLLIIPFSHILDPVNQGVRNGVWKGMSYQTYAFRYQGEEIWGLTARVLHNLISILTVSY